MVMKDDMSIRKKDLPKGETFNSLDDIFRAQMSFIAKGQYYKDKLEAVRNETDMGNIGVTLGALLVVCNAWDKSYSLFGDLYTSTMVIYENGKPIKVEVTVNELAKAIQSFLEDTEDIDPKKRTALAEYINVSVEKHLENMIFDGKVVDIPIGYDSSFEKIKTPRKTKDLEKQVDLFKKTLPKWVYSKQSDLTNALDGFSGKLATPNKTGNRKIARRGNYEFSLSASSLEDLTKGLPQSSHKLFDMAKQYVTESQTLTPEVVIPLSTYASYTGTRADTARDTVKEALSPLQALSVKFFKKVEGKDFQTPMGFINIFSSGVIAKGDIVLNFTPEFFSYLQTIKTDSPFNSNMYKIENRYPSAYCFASKIMNHLKMNRKKPNADHLSVIKFLDSTEYIPSVEKVRDLFHRNYKGKIIVPFIRDMNALIDYEIIDEWDFIDENKKVIDKETVKDSGIDNFLKLSVYFKVSDYPLIHAEAEILSSPDNEGEAK